MTKKSKPKLLLINPNSKFKKGIYHSSNFSVPPLNLGVIAALTPSHWDVQILDENFEDFHFIEADLVGFTSFTSSATRAYEIAAIYRKAGIKTVMGGIHVSMVPDEASQYIDIVVVGEAESIWKDVIADFENNELKKIYEGTLEPLYNSPPPAIHLYNNSTGLGSLQTTRGCPMNCDFCSVHTFNGRAYRYRPVEDVVKEFIRIPQERLYIIDDDFYGYGKKHADRAKDICRGFIASGIKKQWYTFTSMNLANDPEALNLMFDAGCRLVLLGIESEIAEQLEASNKTTNLKVGVDNYEKVFDTFHKAGIAVLGSFIFGLDTDTPDTIRRRTDYYIKSSIDCIQPGMLTPLPGTGVYHNLKKANRILKCNFPKDWERYTFFNNVIEPKNMTHEEFSKLMDEEWRRIFDMKVIKRKYLNTLKNTKSVHAAGWALATNLNYHNTVFEGEKENFDYRKIFKELTSMDLPH